MLKSPQVGIDSGGVPQKVLNNWQSFPKLILKIARKGEH